MDWAASTSYFRSCSLQEPILCSTCSRARGRDLVEVIHDGKSAETLGGIPHDTYGMTSLSIGQYVLRIYKQHGLREKDVTKVQTGGPDGDLGSSTC